MCWLQGPTRTITSCVVFWLRGHSHKLTLICRLQDLLKSVYGERSRLRKKMAELDASERETLLKISRKVDTLLQSMQRAHTCVVLFHVECTKACIVVCRLVTCTWFMYSSL